MAKKEQLNLSNFESYFDGKILYRGLDYYKSGNIASLEYDGEVPEPAGILDELINV